MISQDLVKLPWITLIGQNKNGLKKMIGQKLQPEK
jgi:hypothetical protein